VRRTIGFRVSTTVVAAVALVTAAVGASLSDAGAAEVGRLAARRTVERSVHETYPDLTFGNVACPAGVRRAPDVEFTCTVQLPGTFLVVDVEQTDGSGTVSLSTQQAVIPTQALRDFVNANASLPATVDCGAAPIRIARTGQVLSCTAALADGTNRIVDLTVQDTAGTVTVSGVR
jgi:hypothetical protein